MLFKHPRCYRPGVSAFSRLVAVTLPHDGINDGKNYNKIKPKFNNSRKLIAKIGCQSFFVFHNILCMFHIKCGIRAFFVLQENARSCP
jgi:hypothetical protein